MQDTQPFAGSASAPIGVQSVVNNLQNLVVAVNNLTGQISSQFGVNSVYTVSTLPIVGVPTRAFVTDSTVAASGNFGVTVVGSGTHTVPVYFDNTSWKIG